MSEQDYLKDISEIKDLMNRSSRFISLSGLSGIFAGIYAIAGALVAYFYFLPEGNYVVLHGWNFQMLVVILVGVALLSAITAILLTTRKAKQNNVKKCGTLTTQAITNQFPNSHGHR